MTQEMTWEKVFGGQVRHLRTNRGMTQEGLAEELSKRGYQMHPSTLAKMEVGSRPTPVGEIAALAAIFEVPIGVLFEPAEADSVRVKLQAARRNLDRAKEEHANLSQLLDVTKHRIERYTAQVSELEAQVHDGEH